MPGQAPLSYSFASDWNRAGDRRTCPEEARPVTEAPGPGVAGVASWTQNWQVQGKQKKVSLHSLGWGWGGVG